MRDPLRSKSGEAQQFMIRPRIQDERSWFGSGPKSLRAMARSRSELEDNVGVFETQTIEKTGALTILGLWTVV